MINLEKFQLILLVADCAKMIDIDHDTKSAYSDNLGIPGEEAVLQEPDMDQIDVKLVSPNVTGMFDRLIRYQINTNIFS